MRKLVAAMALTVVACGGGDSEARAQALATVGADPTTVRTPAVHEVQMVLNAAGEYRYVPDELTIKAGDTVRWINASGGPHNVQFKADRIPEGAADVLNNARPSATLEIWVDRKKLRSRKDGTCQNNTPMSAAAVSVVMAVGIKRPGRVRDTSARTMTTALAARDSVKKIASTEINVRIAARMRSLLRLAYRETARGTAAITAR